MPSNADLLQIEQSKFILESLQRQVQRDFPYESTLDLPPELCVMLTSIKLHQEHIADLERRQ